MKPTFYRRSVHAVSWTAIVAVALTGMGDLTPDLVRALGVSPEWEKVVLKVALILAAVGSILARAGGEEAACHVEEKLTDGAEAR
jgi:hypothetical protein